MVVGGAVRLLKNLHHLPEIFDAYRRAGHWLDLSLRYLGVVSRSFPYDLQLRDGVRFRFESDEEIRVFWNIFFRSTYDIDPDDRLILDAGANIGMYAVWAASLAPGARIISLEPWPATYERLFRHLQMNAVTDRVIPARLALAGACGWRQMLGSDDESCKNRLRIQGTPSAPAGPSSHMVLAPILTLEAVMQQFGVGSLDLLKMDIEGGEYEALLATPVHVLRRIRKINLEYHEVPAHLGYTRDLLFAHLAEAGHAPLKVVEDPFRTGVALFSRAGPRPMP